MIMIDTLYRDAVEAFVTGQYDAGRPALQRALHASREGPSSQLSGQILALGARWYGCHGEWDLAASMAIESRWAFEDQGLSGWAQWIAAFTGLAQVQLGQTQKGRTTLEQALTQLQAEAPERLIDGRCWLAQALLLLDERDTARGYLQELLIPTRPEEKEELYRQGVIALLLASLEVDARHWPLAGRAAQLATDWFAELGHVPYWVSARALFGLHCVGLEQWEEAAQVFDVAVPLLQETRHVTVDVAIVLKAAAAVEQVRGREKLIN